MGSTLVLVLHPRHSQLTLRVVGLARQSGRLRGSGRDARWCTLAEAHELPLSKLSRRTLELAALDGPEA